MISNSLAPVFVALLAGGSSSALIAVFRITLERKKMGADTTKTNVDSAVVVSTAALEQMKAAIAESQRASARTTELEKKVQAMESREDAYQDLAVRHQAWDVQAMQELRRHNPNFPEPPKLSL